MSISITTTAITELGKRYLKAAEFFEDALEEMFNDALKEVHHDLEAVWPGGPVQERMSKTGNVFKSDTIWEDKSRGSKISAAASHRHDTASPRKSGRRRKQVSKRGRRGATPRGLQGSGAGGGGRMFQLVTRDDEKVCPICDALEGLVYTVAEAGKLLPVHHGCRCQLVPADDKRFGPVVPDDPSDAVMAVIKQRLPGLFKKMEQKIHGG